MKLLVRKTYGVVVYVWSGLLLLNPSVVDYPGTTLPVILSFVLSSLALILLLLSASGMGVVRLVPFRIHLAMNMLLCGILMCAPFVFDYSAANWLVHFCFGISLLVATLFVYSRQFTFTKKPNRLI